MKKLRTLSLVLISFFCASTSQAQSGTIRVIDGDTVLCYSVDELKGIAQSMNNCEKWKLLNAEYETLNLINDSIIVTQRMAVDSLTYANQNLTDANSSLLTSVMLEEENANIMEGEWQICRTDLGRARRGKTLLTAIGAALGFLLGTQIN